MSESSEQFVRPVLKNFIKSLRDIGYTFEIAVADIIDNSISASCSYVNIYAVQEENNAIFQLLDDGIGMTNVELIEAMRIATSDPDEKREKNDLGRFGLGLKTASFSQCTVLTVISKKQGQLSIKQWDLDLLAKKNDWILITPNLSTYSNLTLFKELNEIESGTLVIWEKIDRFESAQYALVLDKLRKHLSLVFHRFLSAHFDKKLRITINRNPLKPFDPFNTNHKATLEKAEEIINYNNKSIVIKPFILPHHSKVNQQEWEFYATEDGYIKSQGFYLYRANRLIIYGTWWGLHRATDAHKLVRIQIDITNDQDKFWGIDIKKSTATPLTEIKKELKNIINNVTKEGAKPFSTRGRIVKDKNLVRFWDRVVQPNEQYFKINFEHPLIIGFVRTLDNNQSFIFKNIVMGIETYLPLQAIQVALQETPHLMNQEILFPKDERIELVNKLTSLGFTDEEISGIIKSEIVK